jgi:type I restriction enzyme S subunit
MIDLKPAHLKKVKKILSGNVPEYGVMVYGSRATGKAKPYSYLDLAIMTDKPMPVPRLEKLAAAFTEAHFPFRVETIDWAGTGKDFRKEIQRTAVVLQPAPKA